MYTPPQEGELCERRGKPRTLTKASQRTRLELLGPFPARTVDDRACVFLQLELLRHFHDTRPRHDVVAVFSVQEEVGLRGATLRASGTFDARGTLGVDRAVPVGVQDVVVTVEVDVPADVDDATLDRLAATVERYCVVGQSLRAPARFELGRRTS